MRKAFTMIELVFVIVILGILASVAIPKLSATRDDAEVAAGVQRLSSFVSDVGGYYTAHGHFDLRSKMTKIVLVDSSNAQYDGNLTTEAFFGNTAKTKRCFGIKVDDMNGTLKIRDLNDGSAYCQALSKVASNFIKTHKFGGSNVY